MWDGRWRPAIWRWRASSTQSCEQAGQTLTVRQADALGALMDLSDNDLLDVQLARKSLTQVDAQLDTEDVREVLKMLREPL